MYSAAVPSRRAAVASASSRDWSEAAPGKTRTKPAAEVAGEVQEAVDLLHHGFVVAGRGHPRVPGETEDLHARRLELGDRVGPFGEPDTGVHRLLRMRAQFYSVIAVRGREPQHVGEGEAGDTEGGERQFHGPYSHPVESVRSSREPG